MKLALSLLIGAMLVAGSAEAATWRWSYQGEGVAASGTFVTTDEPNADGFYEITGIKGEANGVAIRYLDRPKFHQLSPLVSDLLKHGIR